MRNVALPLPSLGGSRTSHTSRADAIKSSLELGNGRSLPVAFLHEYSVQHTLSWDAAITLGGVTLSPGSCNLYGFPAVSAPGEEPQMLTGRRLELLCRAILAAATSSDAPEGGGGMCHKADASGAYVLHVLLIANTPAALALAMALAHARPRLLLQSHAEGFFTGEHGLHILAVNRRESELCVLLQLAGDRLNPQELHGLLTEQVKGGFFLDPPMKYYGGTILGYLAAFGLVRLSHRAPAASAPALHPDADDG